MAKNKATTIKLDPQGVINLYHQLEGRDSALQSTYTQILNDLGLDVSNPSYTFYQIAQERTRQWWEDETDDRSMTVVINLLHQIIEEQRTYLGTMRSVRCPLPLGLFPDEDQAQAYADKLERAVLHLWREWHMARQYSIMGWHATILGQAIGTLSWSDERTIPLFRVRSPRGFYAIPSVDDETRLAQAIFAVEVTGDILAREYPQQCGTLGPSDTVKVVDYYSPTQRTRVAEGIDTPLIDADNTIGRTPVYIFPGILVDGIYGASAVPLAIPIHRELQRLYSIEAELLADAVNAPTVINQPESVPEGWYWGKKAVIEVGPQGKVGKPQLDVVDHGLLDRRIQDMRRSLDEVMDFASIARGDFAGSIVTGRGVNSLLSPNAQRMQIRMDTMNEVMGNAMEDALLLWQQKGKPTTAYGEIRGSKFSLPIDPRKDINPSWCKVQVYVDSANYIDRQAATVNNLQKLRGQPQAMSLRRFLEVDPECEDVEAEIAQINKERNELMQQQMQAMQMAQAQQQPMQEQTNYAAQRGGAIPGEAPPTAGPQAPPTTETPPTGGNDVLDALKAHFASIKKLHGAVYLCGLSAQGDLSAGLEIYLTDPTDKQTIINAFRGDPLLAQIPGNGDLVFRDKPSPNMVQVAGPSAPTPQGGEQVGQTQLPTA